MLNLDLLARKGGYLRLTTQRRWRDEIIEIIKVVNPDAWWVFHPFHGVETLLVSPPPRPPFPRGSLGQEQYLLDPALLLSTIQIISSESSVWNDRPALRVTALNREFLHLPLEGLWTGAESYELVIDAERGVPFRQAAFAGNEEFAALEVQEIEFDRVLPKAAFMFRVPNGEPVHAPGQGGTLKPKLAEL